MTCLAKQFLFLIYFGVFLVNNVQCDIQELNSVREPLDEFSSYAVVIPKILHSRTKREITSKSDSIHRDHVEIKIDLDGEENVLELHLNTKFIGGDFQLSYDDGKQVVYKKTKYSDISFCQYTGIVKNKLNSWVALSICDGISGVINDGKQIKYIEPRHIKDEQFQHYVYDHSNLVKAHKCGVDSNVIQKKTSETMYINIIENSTSENTYDYVIEDNTFKNTSNNVIENNTENTYPRTRKTRIKRHVEGIPRPVYNNENYKSRYVELLVVIDKSVRNNRKYWNIVDYTQDIVNIVNTMYSSLDIHIVLTQVHEIRSDDANMLAIPSSDATLENFIKYVNNELDTRFDIAFFFTLQKFLKNVAGSALVGAVCSNSAMGIATLYETDSKGTMAATVAHEIGHLFGMTHDTESCACPENKCIMDASSTSFIPGEWSSCSLKYLMLTLDRGSDFCLRNKPSVLYKSPSCGNGILEDGEQCDCGSDIGRPLHRECSVCCLADECLLRENATCATGACCDLKTCHPYAPGRVCRAARRECDLPELCAGEEHCPADLHVMDSAPCAGGEAFCIDGTCQSHSQRCHALFGMGAVKASEEFYLTLNIKGDKFGYCDKTTTRPINYLGDSAVTYTKCSESDVMCGKLLCASFSPLRQHFGHSYDFLKQKDHDLIHCTSSIIDTSNNYENPLLVPNGAKCGENKMCLNQKCISIDVIRTKIANLKDSVCPSDCSGNGICNSKGHCHCNKGFGPPLCDIPGDGGSIDSEFVYKETEVLHKLEVVLYIIFFAIVPIAIGIIVVYCYRKDIMFWYTVNIKYRTSKSPNARTVIDKDLSNLPKTNIQAQQTAANIKERTTINVVNNPRKVNLEDLNTVNNVICQHSPANTSKKTTIHTTATCDNKQNDIERPHVTKEKLCNPIAHDEINKKLLIATKKGDFKNVKNTSRRSSKNKIESDAETSDSVKNIIKKFNKP